MRVPMAIEEEEPAATLAASAASAATAAPAAPAASAAAAAAAPAAAAADSGARGEPARRGPAPVYVSEEARVMKGVRVPDGPTSAEKELSYLTRIPLVQLLHPCSGARRSTPRARGR